jgi:hypothetical protein
MLKKISKNRTLVAQRGIRGTKSKRPLSMKEKFRYPYDRRSGSDRREPKKAEEMPETGVERRSGQEQRLWSERRKEWTKSDDWSSVWSELHEDKEEPTD